MPVKGAPGSNSPGASEVTWKGVESNDQYPNHIKNNKAQTTNCVHTPWKYCFNSRAFCATK